MRRKLFIRGVKYLKTETVTAERFHDDSETFRAQPAADLSIKMNKCNACPASSATILLLHCRERNFVDPRWSYNLQRLLYSFGRVPINANNRERPRTHRRRFKIWLDRPQCIIYCTKRGDITKLQLVVQICDSVGRDLFSRHDILSATIWRVCIVSTRKRT